MKATLTATFMALVIAFAASYQWPDSDYHSAAQSDAIRDVEQQARVELAEIQIERGIR